jgi:hypothetical protein
MKVYENQGLIQPTHAKKAHKNGAKDEEFQKIMDQAQAAGVMKDEDASVVAAPIAPQPQGVQILQGAEKSVQTLKAKEMVLNELRTTLDLVDFYAEKLGNTSLPITGFAPLIEHLDERLQNLQGMQADPELPQKLKPIVNDVVVTLGTEIAKFKRGDYL